MDQKISPESECEEEARPWCTLHRPESREHKKTPERERERETRVSGVREGARPVGASSGPSWKLWGRVLIVTLPPIS